MTAKPKASNINKIKVKEYDIMKVQQAWKGYHQLFILKTKVGKLITTSYLYASSSSKHSLFINAPWKALCISSSFTIREKYILIAFPNLQNPLREGYKYSTRIMSSAFMEC